MHPEKEKKKYGREKLQRIIQVCTAIQNHTVDPFLLNVDDIIKVVKEYFPNWNQPEDLNLDAATIHHLASVIKLQSEWIESRSTSLYTDPFLLEEKIMQASKEEMLNIFLKAWHPLVELEQLNIPSLEKALRYWESLLPLKERWPELAFRETEIGFASRDELIRQCILGDDVFSEKLEYLWHELKKEVKEKGRKDRILYWDFVGAETYADTVQKAFLTSFLITYGYATLEIYPLEEEVFIKPYEEPLKKVCTQQSISIPLAITFEDWQKWKKGELF